MRTEIAGLKDMVASLTSLIAPPSTVPPAAPVFSAAQPHTTTSVTLTPSHPLPATSILPAPVIQPQPSTSTSSHNVTLPTPLNLSAISSLLAEYHDKSFVIDGIKFGFNLGFLGEDTPVSCANSPTLFDNLEAGLCKVADEIQKGRISGPFIHQPFKNFKCSPLALRAKPEKGKFRLLHNLSAPYNYKAVNLNIPDSNATVSYQSINDALHIMNKHKSPVLRKVI